MRVIPRRNRDRPRNESTSPPEEKASPAPSGGAEPAAEAASGGAEAASEGTEARPEAATRPLPAGSAAGAGEPAEALGQESPRGGSRPEAATAVLPAASAAKAGDSAKPGDTAKPGEAAKAGGTANAGDAAKPGDVPEGEAARRRARAAERRRQAAEVKRSRAGRRRPRKQSGPPTPAKAAEQHRSALLVMVLTLGLLIAAVAVTGGLIASSMRTRPVALAAPLRIYPVAEATPGPCPAGTAGITGQAGTGPTCYRLTQGIAIHKVSGLKVQKSRVKPGGYDVALTLRPVDRDAFARLTRATVGRDLAFVVRDRLVTLPRVDMAITDGKVVVTGSPDRATANRLVRDLKGGR
ncbi:hypothetical protein SAMN05443665_1002292 [Actinomadura meyerae]|uniref:SecDF P1 head subdomain domain-containing protein n=1 Tax=Actinomadura meyerae TaxID=240840 RepID=A0A239DG65_9ACTN|nr:hypothetical protein [Actinomadura meyerae]SNS31425.1 hypothetical protein SAMN05443665_1002292 [Actinomadura meyerae]